MGLIVGTGDLFALEPWKNPFVGADSRLQVGGQFNSGIRLALTFGVQAEIHPNEPNPDVRWVGYPSLGMGGEFPVSDTMAISLGLGYSLVAAEASVGVVF